MRPLVTSLFTCAIFYCYAPDNWGAEPEVRFNLLTLPSTRAASARLNAPAQIAYENVTLRACVNQLAEHYEFSYWIDRHVDADRRISLKLPSDDQRGDDRRGDDRRGADLRSCLNGLAKLCEAEVGLVENVVTIARADRLAAMQYTAVRFHDQLSRGTTPTHGPPQLLPLDWEILTTPDELVDRIATKWGFQFAADLPHDLMNAGQLQPCTAATQLTLLLGGFDKCAVGRSLRELRVTSLPTAASWKAVYPRSAIPPANLKNLPALLAEYPGAKATDDAGNLIVVGMTSAHLRLLTAPSSGGNAPRASSQSQGRQRGEPSKANPDQLSRQRITFTTISDQPVAAVIEALAKQMSFEVRWDESLSPRTRQTLVTLEAKEDSLDSILQRLASQTDLAIMRRGTVVTIGPHTGKP